MHSIIPPVRATVCGGGPQSALIETRRCKLSVSFLYDEFSEQLLLHYFLLYDCTWIGVLESSKTGGEIADCLELSVNFGQQKTT